MINSTLRRAGLVLAVIASFSIRAAAQTDAAFVSALSKMPAGLAVMAQLKTQTQVPAAPTGPRAPADVWREVVNKACMGFNREIKGSEKDGYSCMYTFRLPNVTMRITILTDNNPRRTGGTIYVRAGRLEQVAAQYDAAARQWRVDVWNFTTDPSGMLVRARQETAMGPTPDKLGEGTTVDLDLADPKTAATYNAMLSFWEKF